MKAIFSGALLLLVSATSLLFISSSDSGNKNSWSKPELIYLYPGPPSPNEFQADVHQEIIHIVGGYRYMKEGRYLEDSKIFYLQKEVDEEPEVLLLPTNDYPSERPSLLLDRSGTVHFLWGDRRLDPEFEEWKTERPQGLGFSTNVIYSWFDGNQFTTPESIYEGHLREQFGGMGDILLPAEWIEDSQGQLHTLFIADSTHTVSTQDDEEMVNLGSAVKHMIRSSTGEWNHSRFLHSGALFEITILPNERLVVAYLGSVPDQRSINDVLVITSDDGGNSWSEPQLVFLSGQQPGRQLGLKTGPDGTIHLVWGRQTRGLPIPNELWHSYSEDGGDSWSEPVRFFMPEQSAQNENFIGSLDLAIDHAGQLHCVAMEVNLQQMTGTLYYATWNPETKSWEREETPDVVEAQRNNVELSLDETTGKLYVFWDEAEEDAIYYSVKELSQPGSPPTIAKSGPLKLHANYPNPFNTSTSISFTIEEPAKVVLTVYNISGRQIIEKDLGTKPAGLHSEEVNLEGLTSGTYIYEVELDNRWRQQSTMMLIR